jgi:hypothetical protein
MGEAGMMQMHHAVPGPLCPIGLARGLVAVEQDGGLAQVGLCAGLPGAVRAQARAQEA